VINPYTKLYGWWCAFVLFTDATYTAFVVPIGVGFNTSSVQWDWVGYFDFIAGEALQDQRNLIYLYTDCMTPFGLQTMPAQHVQRIVPGAALCMQQQCAGSLV